MYEARDTARAMEEKDVEAAQRAVEVFNRGDLQSFQALFAPDAEIVPLRAEMENTVFRGPRAAKEFFAATQETWDSAQAEIEEIRDGGDRLLVLGTFRAYGKASGAEVSLKIAWIVRFRDGAITRFHLYVDRGKALKAAGLAE
jgi:ketosteroid isomerase-like protein